MEAHPIPNQEAVTVVKTLVDYLFCRFFRPKAATLQPGTSVRVQLVGGGVPDVIKDTRMPQP